MFMITGEIPEKEVLNCYIEEIKKKKFVDKEGQNLEDNLFFNEIMEMAKLTVEIDGIMKK